MKPGTADMIEVPSAEYHQNIGRYEHLAQTQAIAVTDGGNHTLVLLSAEEYQRLKRRDRQVMSLDDFTQLDIAALEATRAPESSKAFDTDILN